MAWHSSNYLYRTAITVDNSAGAAGAGKYINLTLPASWSMFWDTVQSTGYDVRFTLADGVTTIPQDRVTWTYASGVGVFELGPWTAPAGSPCVIWLYWGYAAATDPTTAIVPVAPLTAYIDTLGIGGSFLVVYRREMYGDTVPAQRVQKSSTDQVDCWIDFSAGLLPRADQHQGDKRGQEIESVEIAINNAGGADQTGMYDETKNRVVGASGLVKIRLKAGTTATDYTVTVTATTSGDANSPGQVLVQKFILNVRDVIDS